MKHELIVKETGNKAGKFHYMVVDESGNVISERRSNRNYVACTSDGSFYFGRIDLIGKGDHGKAIKFASGWDRDEKGNIVPGRQPISENRLAKLNDIAFKKDLVVS